MVRHSTALRLSPFALILACQQPATPAAPAGLTDADRAAIDSLHTAFAAAAVAGDFAKVASMYTEDASVMAPNQPVATGRTAIQQTLAAFPPLGEMKLLTHDADGSDKFAAVRGTYVLLMAPPGSPAIADTGSYVELWRKEADGKWLIVWDIFNSHKPAPAIH
jgi:uncharacterized protein (TIGR02246 family)